MWGASEVEKATEISVSLVGLLVWGHSVRKGAQYRTENDTGGAKRADVPEKHRGYPALSCETLVRIVTSTDLRKVDEAEGAQTRVDPVMARKLYLIGPEEEASTAMKKMNDMQIRRLPVIDEGRLVGIVSKEDLVRALSCAESGEN